MKYEKILAERPDKVIYKDGENALKVFIPIILKQIY